MSIRASSSGFSLINVVLLLQLRNAFSASVSILNVNSNDITKEVPANIVWNGCETETTYQVYMKSTLEKPPICVTHLPEYLTAVKPMPGKAPFVAHMKSNSVNSKQFLITITPRHYEKNGRIKSYDVSKRLAFQAIYVSAVSPKGYTAGEFLTDIWGTNGRFDMGYCCGKSRHRFNFYELVVKGGDWTADITWDALRYKGPIVFRITVVQNERTYWKLDPITEIVD